MRVELGYLHYAASAALFPDPFIIEYGDRLSGHLNRGQLHRIIYRALLGVLTLLAIFNWPLSTRWRRFWLVISFTSAMRCVLARLYHQSRLYCQGYAIEAITATIDWIKENGFHSSKPVWIRKIPFQKNYLSDWLQFFEHRRWVSIFMFWINKRRIISRREKPMRPFQAYFTCIRQCHLPFPVNGLAFNFQVHHTFSTETYPSYNYVLIFVRKYLSTQPEALMLENVIIRNQFPDLFRPDWLSMRRNRMRHRGVFARFAHDD